MSDSCLVLVAQLLCIKLDTLMIFVVWILHLCIRFAVSLYAA